MLGFPPNDGINYESPIIQSMGGMGSIPPTPIGNIANIGGIGYMPGRMMNSAYYNNTFSYNNPYLMLQRQRAMEAAKKEAERRQSDAMKSLSRIAHQAIGDMKSEEELEEHLKRNYDYESRNAEMEVMVQELRNYNKLANLKPVQPNYNYLAYAQKVSKSYKDKYPDDMSLADFLDKAGELYRDALVEMHERDQKNGKLKYNSNSYKNIVDMHRSSSSYFNDILTGKKSIDIGDLEIQIPDGERPKMVLNMPSKMQEYADRKAKFIAACLSGTKVGGA